MGKNFKTERVPFAVRHPRWNFILGAVILIALIGIGVFIIYLLVKYLGIGISKLSTWLSNLASNVDAVIIVALITGSVSIITVLFTSVISKIIEYKQKRREYLYQKREDPYSDFVELVYKTLDRAKSKTEYTEREMLQDMSSFSQKLTLWGSNRVIKQWLRFRGFANSGKDKSEIVFVMEDVMFAMRKDMGLRKMKKGSLIKFFVNDLDDVMKKRK